MQSTDYSIPAFPAFPSTTRYVPLGSLREAVDRICCSIDAREGTALVIGPPGTGKSLLCRLLIQQYQSTHDVVLIGDTPIEDRDAFLRHLLHELGADADGVFAGDLHLALKDHVCNKSEGDGLLLVIDEAQKLSTEVIEAVRMVTNIMRDGEPRTFVVLSGGVKLDEILIDSSLEAFTQRVATRCYLHPMNSDETRQYISDTIVACGGDPEETITSAATTIVHQVCSGIPRLVNQIMTQAIDVADEMNRKLIAEDVINRAWAELQQLPSPIVEEPRLAKSDSMVEFGELSEVDDFASWSSDGSTSSGSAQTVLGSATSGGQDSIENELQEIDCHDIEVDSSTADLLDERELELELDEEPQGREVLFGEFDHEEEIAVGSGYAIAASNTSIVPSDELEEILHQEIVAATTGSDDDKPVEVKTTQFESDAGETDAPRGGEHGVDCVIQMPSVEEQTMPSDDRDILVIEDEIDLRSSQPGTRVDRKQQTISVDFQAMLSQMRSN